MIIRVLDVLFSVLGMLILSPILVFVAFLIKIESKGPVFYKQIRVGKNNIEFKLLKFRSMYLYSDQKGLITVGKRDARVTNIGRFIRKSKIDELPQLFNVLKGEMSIVGPRPEVRKYVDLYSESQRKVLTVKPGITDYASVKFKDENAMLEDIVNPEEFYIDIIMPQKLKLNLIYINNSSVLNYLKIIILTFKSVFK